MSKLSSGEKVHRVSAVERSCGRGIGYAEAMNVDRALVTPDLIDAERLPSWLLEYIAMRLPS